MQCMTQHSESDQEKGGGGSSKGRHWGNRRNLDVGCQLDNRLQESEPSLSSQLHSASTKESVLVLKYFSSECYRAKRPQLITVKESTRSGGAGPARGPSAPAAKSGAAAAGRGLAPRRSPQAEETGSSGAGWRAAGVRSPGVPACPAASPRPAAPPPRLQQPRAGRRGPQGGTRGRGGNRGGRTPHPTFRVKCIHPQPGPSSQRRGAGSGQSVREPGLKAQ